jgi:hypothetical protein
VLTVFESSTIDLKDALNKCEEECYRSPAAKSQQLRFRTPIIPASGGTVRRGATALPQLLPGVNFVAPWE